MQYFDVWVDDQVGPEAIMGMNYMVPAGIRSAFVDKTLVLPDEVRNNLAERNS